LAIAPVSDWITAVEVMGPPSNAALIEEPDRYLAAVDGTRVTVEYLVIDYEFLVIVREIR
jgi:hypothetical protein